MLRPLAAMNIFNNLSGILLGRPGGTIPPDQFPKYDEALREIVVEEAGCTDLPIITNMDFGHTDPLFVIPYGALTEINCDTQQVILLESAVT
jgi:muramoyltetrapeptide carboxypeptidase LdcA involved in peptidoglycan recycling